MNLNLNFDLAKNYKSNAQKIRVVSESWAERNVYCSSCGGMLKKSDNNARVLDFSCQDCFQQFELKSVRGRFSRKVTDGAYDSMIARLRDVTSPNFLFLTYDGSQSTVTNLFVVPTYFMDGAVIEKRRPLQIYAKRAGWIGCNILLDRVPEVGKIFYVKNAVVLNKKTVIASWESTKFLRNEKSFEARGWTLEVLRNIQSLGVKEFTLQQMYDFELKLQKRFPGNNFVKEKIRQQLQVLRDAGLISFEGRGRYAVC